MNTLKIKLDIKQENELLQWFNKIKEEIVQLKEKIEFEDQNIDNMIFDLYGLNEAEKKEILNISN
ncbi:hypothetical protein GF366_03315 [Candidatus Peregrinibacteria bacterium]|nr:hypothetical protein [Candidatus Peregrinibacteria bacterium]